MDRLMQVACDFYDKTYFQEPDAMYAEEAVADGLIDSGVQDVEWHVSLLGDTRYAVIISDSHDVDDFKIALSEELWTQFPDVSVYVEVGH